MSPLLIWFKLYYSKLAYFEVCKCRFFLPCISINVYYFLFFMVLGVRVGENYLSWKSAYPSERLVPEWNILQWPGPCDVSAVYQPGSLLWHTGPSLTSFQFSSSLMNNPLSSQSTWSTIMRQKTYICISITGFLVKINYKTFLNSSNEGS